MPRQVSIEDLKKDMANLLDEVIETRIPIEIEIKGKRLLISPVESPSKLDRLEEHPGFMVGDPEDLVHLDWSSEWRPEP